MKHLWTMCLVAACITGCIGEHRDARDKYNEGVAALAKGEYDAAEKALLDARSGAGVDPELRFRAAYDLGVAFAAHADHVKAGKDADLAKALDLAQQAASWLGDADRLRPGHADTKANLGIVRARIQAINDELRKGEGKLEIRLDHLIDDQRGVLDEARAAWLAVKQAGGSDPLAQQGPLTTLADKERGIVAEAGVVGDLAADEIDAIGKKPEDKRSDEEKVRVVQLKNLDLYLLEGRTRITEARRKLQELAAEDGVARSEAALVALKRAREQLLDPITVMRKVAQDELAVLEDTAHSDTKALQLGDAAAPAALPGWLAPKLIGERQGSVRDRLEEVRARLTAAVEAPRPSAPADPQAAAKPEDPRQQKLLERVKAALPSVGDASAAMDRARQALTQPQIKQALDHEQAALEALAHAIEQFSDLKQTIELAWAEHQELLRLLTPEAAKQLDAAKRGKQTRDALSHNLGRMPRLQELLAEEVAQLDEQAAAAAAKASDPPKDPKQAEAQKQQLEQQKQQLEQQKQQLARAEELRGQAATALGALDKALTANQDPMPPARDADAKLTELRKLFFSVIEHLKELIREQGETRDQTSAANTEDDFTRAPKLPGLITRQDGHATLAKAITDALAQQADAAGKQPAQPGQPQQGPDAKALAGAADEVRQSQGDMADAKATLVKARDAKNATESLTPGEKSQAKAIEHLENALKLLSPPPKKTNQKDDKDQQQQQQQQQAKQEPKPQQGGAGQRARDEDAKRQRDRRNRESQADPVEKDW
jgi:Ca-activated chloride channel homolog